MAVGYFIPAAPVLVQDVLEEVDVTSIKRGAASLGETSFTISVLGGKGL